MKITINEDEKESIKNIKKIVELRMRKNKIVHDTAIVGTLDLYNLLNVIKKYERR